MKTKLELPKRKLKLKELDMRMKLELLKRKLKLKD
jgi:hypothetical protein